MKIPKKTKGEHTMEHYIINPKIAGEKIHLPKDMPISRRDELIKNMISALRYYGGLPDTHLFDLENFGAEVALATKAYITFNTITGVESAAKARHKEKKKQTPALLTYEAIEKTMEMFKYIFMYALATRENITYETVRACRQSEIAAGESVVTALTSTTKHSIEKNIELGYAKKNQLAIVRYRFHPGALVCDMEKMGIYYVAPKNEERELLILPGNRLVATCLGLNETYRGLDGEPAMMYVVDVYPPDNMGAKMSNEEVILARSIVLDPNALAEIQRYFVALNNFNVLPDEPECYHTWQAYLKQLVMHQLTEAMAIMGN